MVNQKQCFIIMPITTPESMIGEYRDGEEHFQHVLDCFFIPAITKAGYVPQPPLAKGSDLIHAEIIKNIESSDIVLCDMSCLNPNVFFEFGIRTSLNKPVCVVKDELTKSVPFDTAMLNYHEYKSSLDPWHLETEIKKLSDHLTASVERSKGENTLWKYFGLKSEAVPYQGGTGVDAKLDYLSFQIESMKNKLETSEESQMPLAKDIILSSHNIKQAFIDIDQLLPGNVKIENVRHRAPNRLYVYYKGDLNSTSENNIRLRMLDNYNVNVIFRNRFSDDDRSVIDSSETKTD